MSNQLSSEAMREIQQAAFAKVVDAISAVRLIRDHHGSGRQAYEEIEKILAYLEAWGRSQPQGNGWFALHGALAIRAWLHGGEGAQKLYAEMGAKWMSLLEHR